MQPVDCQGVPAQQCEGAVEQARGVSRATLVQVVVRCSAPPCTDEAGQMDVQALYSDGNTTGWSSAWAAAVPMPAPTPLIQPDAPLSIKPLCLNVPDAICEEMAWSSVSGLPSGGPAVRSISVRCSAVCTPTKAEGTVSIVFADGTSTFSSWGYDGGG
jgi:hypothetical protein